MTKPYKIYTKARARSCALKSKDPRRLYYWRDNRTFDPRNRAAPTGLVCGVFRGGGEALWVRVREAPNITAFFTEFLTEFEDTLRLARHGDPTLTIRNITTNTLFVYEFTWAKNRAEANMIALLTGDTGVRNF